MGWEVLILGLVAMLAFVWPFPYSSRCTSQGHSTSVV